MMPGNPAESLSCGDASAGNPTGGRQETLLSYGFEDMIDMIEWSRRQVRKLAHKTEIHSKGAGPRFGRIDEWGTETTRSDEGRSAGNEVRGS